MLGLLARFSKARRKLPVAPGQEGQKKAPRKKTRRHSKAKGLAASSVAQQSTRNEQPAAEEASLASIKSQSAGQQPPEAVADQIAPDTITTPGSSHQNSNTQTQSSEAAGLSAPSDSRKSKSIVESLKAPVLLLLLMDTFFA